MDRTYEEIEPWTSSSSMHTLDVRLVESSTSLPTKGESQFKRERADSGLGRTVTAWDSYWDTDSLDSLEHVESLSRDCPVMAGPEDGREEGRLASAERRRGSLLFKIKKHLSRIKSIINPIPVRQIKV